MAQLQLVFADILTLPADALVCPAHKHLIRGCGLSAQIYDRASRALVNECRQQPRCAIGEARLTRAPGLISHYLLHTVTPQWSSGDQWGAEALVQLRECYQSVLQLAREQGFKRLLFPALGAGTNRFPHEIAAHQGLDVLHKGLEYFSIVKVCLHTPSALADWKCVQKRFYDK